jgi:hypothetical protein
MIIHRPRDVDLFHVRLPSVAAQCGMPSQSSFLYTCNNPITKSIDLLFYQKYKERRYISSGVITNA